MNNFYYISLSLDPEIVEVDGKEARHMIGARRLKAGDEVTLFNGKGLIGYGQIKSVTTKVVSIVVSQVKQTTLPNPRIVLASALPKGDRANIMLDMATQLGMTDFVPLDCERSIITSIENKLERYKRICINACKQSQRYYLPEIHSAMTPRQLIEQNVWTNKKFFLADPDAISKDEILVAATKSQAIILIVGPEGGFSEPEQKLFDRQQIKRIKLSPAILRIETACVSLLAKINHRQIA